MFNVKKSKYWFNTDSDVFHGWNPGIRTADCIPASVLWDLSRGTESIQPPFDFGHFDGTDALVWWGDNDEMLSVTALLLYIHIITVRKCELWQEKNAITREKSLVKFPRIWIRIRNHARYKAMSQTKSLASRYMVYNLRSITSTASFTTMEC